MGQTCTTNKLHWLIVILGISSIIIDFSVFMSRIQGDSTHNIINYFSYFTVLSNIILVLSSLILLLKPSIHSQIFQAFRLESIICIIITGIVYNLLLRPVLTPPTWIAHISNELYHVINPILGFWAWITLDSKPMVTLKTVVWAIVPPMFYAVYIFCRGAITGFYPYFFINVPLVGISKTIIAVCGVIVLFFMVAGCLYLIEKYLLSRQKIVK